MKTKENCYFLTKKNGFRIVDGYGVLEWLKSIFKSKSFYNQIQNTKIRTKDKMNYTE